MDEIPEGWDQELYKKLNFYFLIECAENKRIDEWNALYLKYLESEWKRLYPKREWDPKNVVELVDRESLRLPERNISKLEARFHREPGEMRSWFIRPSFGTRDFREAISRSVSFSHVHIEGADLTEAHLEGVDLLRAHLEGADLSGATLYKAYLDWAHFEGADLYRAHLEWAHLTEAHLERAHLYRAHLERADLYRAHLEEAYLTEAHLEEAYLTEAHLKGAYLKEAHLDGADFKEAHLDGADLKEAHLDGADFKEAHLDGADFSGAHLDGAKFIYAIADGETLFASNIIDENTDFTGTALSATRINPNLRTRLERNIREIHWRKWYDKAKVSPVRFMKKLNGKIDESKEEEKEDEECIPSIIDRIFINPFVKLFWWLSNYGSSTKRVIGVFFAWNIFWAFIYQFLLPLQQGPILENASTMVLDTPDIFTAILQTNLMVFSITDLATEGLDYPAFICVTLHIVIGYFILAALITRLGIMFQNLSP